MTFPRSMSRCCKSEALYLDIDEGGEVELVSGPLTHKELVTLFLRQSVKELRWRRNTEKSPRWRLRKRGKKNWAAWKQNNSIMKVLMIRWLMNNHRYDNLKSSTLQLFSQTLLLLLKYPSITFCSFFFLSSVFLFLCSELWSVLLLLKCSEITLA